MKKIIASLVVSGVLLATMASSALAFDVPHFDTKTHVCHNPGQHQQTLYVSWSAILGHLLHGDYLGHCNPWVPQPSNSPTPTPTASPEATVEPSASPSESPTPTPEESTTPVFNPLTAAGFTPVCYGTTDTVIPWAFATRNGTDATIKYVPTVGDGEHVNVVFSENPFEIVFGLGNHGLRDWTPNNGTVQLHDLVSERQYYFRIQNGCSPWSAMYSISK